MTSNVLHKWHWPIFLLLLFSSIQRIKTSPHSSHNHHDHVHLSTDASLDTQSPQHLHQHHIDKQENTIHEHNMDNQHHRSHTHTMHSQHKMLNRHNMTHSSSMHNQHNMNRKHMHSQHNMTRYMRSQHYMHDQDHTHHQRSLHNEHNMTHAHMDHQHNMKPDLSEHIQEDFAVTVKEASNETNGNWIIEEERPQWKKDLDFATTIILTGNTIVLMLGMGCATYWRQVIGHAWPPTGIMIGMFCQFLLLPFCGSMLSYVFNFTKYEAMGVLIVSCSPGGSLSNFFCYWCDGDLALSIVMTTFSSMLAFFAMPFNLWLYSRLWIDPTEPNPMVVPYSSVMTALVFITVPVIVGMAIRHYNQRIAKKITKAASIIGWVMVLATFVIWTILYWKVFFAATSTLYLAAVLLPILGFVISYGIARILCRSHKICRTIGIETGFQNMVVALSIILISFKEPEVKASMLLFPTLYGIILILELFIGIGAFQFWRKKYGGLDDDDYYPEALTAVIENGTSKEMNSLTRTIS